MFDWLTFLDQQGITYLSKYSGDHAGNVSIKCPFCGTSDPSQHMAISISGRGWKCWRNQEHRGRSPTRLIMAIVGCSAARAHEIVGTRPYIPDNFLAAVQGRFDLGDVKEESKGLTLPSDFKPITLTSPSCHYYVDYLARRGFLDSDISNLTKRYGIHYCSLGQTQFKGRIIFPIVFDSKLVLWTGRSIHASAEMRYLTLSQDDDPPAMGAITDYLLWYDLIMRSDADEIYLVEGPFDALKLMTLGRREGIVATCFFTNSISDAQVNLLYDILPRFRRRYVLLDRSMYSQSLRIMWRLQSLGVKALQLKSVKDPGELKSIEELKHETQES